MKLIQRINKQYILFSLVVLVVAGISLFFGLKAIIVEEIDEKLENALTHLELSNNQQIHELEFFPIISIQKVYGNISERYFTDTIIKIKNELIEFRQLTDFVDVNGGVFKVNIRESKLESEDLFEALAIIVLLSFFTLLVLLFIVNKRIASSIWKPFFENLEKLKRFSVQSLEPFIPNESDTTEFEELNVVLKSLTDKVISDYENLKKFSENASHELQTPLAIIRSKIEALLEGNELTQNQVEKIQTIYKTVNRLSKINSGLVLLTKIENRQFTGHEEISLHELIKTQIESFNELIEIKELDFNFYYKADWVMTGDKILIEMLVNNLFSNAILHNTEKGRLIIELDDHLLKFSNTSTSEILERDKLFERFYKSGTTGSTGLGLAISRQICNIMNLQIEYSFENKLHCFVFTSF